MSANHFELLPRHHGSAQQPKFMSDSNRWFGVVFREAGPVVPSTFEMVAIQVA